MAAEVLTGTLAPGQWFHHEVTLPVGHDGLRANLAPGNAPTGAQLYLRQGVPSTLSEYTQRTIVSGPKTLVVREGVERSGTWYVSVHWPTGSAGNFDYDLQVTPGWATDLTWDPGTALDGTQPVSAPDARGGLYYFRVTSPDAGIGAWRSRVTVTAGDADLAIFTGLVALPPEQSGTRSQRAGSDGLILTSSPGQTTYTIVVSALPGSAWSLFAGQAYAAPLPDLATVDPAAPRDSALAAARSFTIPPEGQVLFRTTASSSTAIRAWRLWAYQGSGASVTTWSGNLALRRTQAALVDGNRDWQQPGQLLVVPPYLGTGSDTYFLALSGEPGTSGVLDSRPQTVTDLPFASFTGGANPPVTIDVPAGEAGEGRFGYRTFRVTVPIQQLGWEVTVTPESGPRPGVAVRRNDVPSEWFHDAFSDGPGASPAGLTIAPPLLVDGTWFVTVYGTGPYRVQLSSRPPAPTPIEVTTDNATTPEPGRAGWHYFVLTDIATQLEILGWQLELAGVPSSTELTLRRNALPYRHRVRNGYGTSASLSGAVDAASTAGFLQRPGQPADIWYVGVNTGIQPAGAFQLDTFPLGVTTIGDFNADDLTITAQRPGELRFYQFEIPAAVGGEDLLGWEVKVADLVGQASAQVRRSNLPNFVFGDNNLRGDATTWPPGFYAFLSNDPTRRATSADGTRPQDGGLYGLFPMGQPLEAGTYYVAVQANGTEPISYRLVSRGVGPGLALPVTQIAFDGGEAVSTAVSPRDLRFHAVDVPAGQTSWRLRLENQAGESLLWVRRGFIPGTGTFIGSDFGLVDSLYPFTVARDGDETLIVGPTGGDTIAPGRYYLAVVSEGDTPVGTRIGAGPSSFTLRSEGPQPVVDLGTIASGETVTRPDAYAGGDHQVYRFTVPAGVLALEVRLTNRVGNPYANLVAGTDLPRKSVPFLTSGNSAYGVLARVEPLASGTLLSLNAPAPGTYTLLVGDGTHHGGYGGVNAGSYTLEIEARTESVLDFTDGVAVVTNQEPGTWQFFRVDVPDPGTGDGALLGWQVRLEDITTSGLQLAVRRDEVPSPSQPGLSGTSLSWPSGSGFFASSDQLARPHSADGTRTSESTGSFTLPFGQPLEPGTYYLGVFLNAGYAPTSYRLISRAVGPNAPVPVQFLAEPGTQGTASLPARDQAVFVVDVPPNQRSWQVRAEFEEGGDGIVFLRRQFLPNTQSIWSDSVTRSDMVVTQLSSRNGSERFLLLPESGQDFLPVGRFAFLVHSRGANPTGSQRVGPDATVVHFHNDGPLAIEDLGPVGVGESLERAVSYPAGLVRAFRFNVPAGTPAVELALADRVGNPAVTVIRGARIPRPFGNPFGHTVYGVYAGANGTGSTSLVTLAEPVADEYLVVVADSIPLSQGTTAVADGAATLRLTALAPVPLAFNGGEVEVVNQPPQSWRYFAVTVTDSLGLAQVLGWEVRMDGLDSWSTRNAIRRGLLPTEGFSFVPPANPWPVGREENLTTDFTQRSSNPGGSLPRTFHYRTAMGNPLTPDTYYVGIQNLDTIPISYRLTSAAIGAGLALPVTEVFFAGGEATVAGLAPRDSHTFAVDIPEGVYSWEVEALGGASDVDLYVRRAYVPESSASTGPFLSQSPFSGVRSARVGDERFVFAPHDGQETLPAGRYYATVVNIGEQAPNDFTVGTGVASVTFRSLGELPVTDLGALAATPIELATSYVVGQHRAYRIEVPPGALAVTVQLENRVGNPAVAAAPGLRLPTMTDNAASFQNPRRRYGLREGITATAQGTNALTLTRPAAGPWTILVGDATPHYDTQQSVRTAAGSYTLRVSQVLPEPLNLSASQNAGGGTHTASATLAAGERRYYDVELPPGLELDGEALLGWRLALQVTQGDAQIRMHFDPERLAEGLTLSAGTHLITPPYLRPGTWQVEVTATSGTTSYTLANSVIELQRPAWAMPLSAADPVAPGVAAGYFGDSGVDETGAPLPGDQGIDLADTDYHVYAVDIPSGNPGLLRTALIALNGNPNLYVRRDAVPSRSHRSSIAFPFFAWNGEGSYERSLTGSGTEYGNWVPIDTKVDRVLPPGRYYIAVQASGTNVRYRLRLSGAELTAPETPTGQRFAQELVLNGSALTGQTLAAGDWRYYRFVWPENAPQTLQFTFTPTSGGVVAYLRADAPPGAGGNAGDYRDWNRDYLNSPPSGVSYVNWTTPGTVSIETTPLRPGSVYWLGFRATADANFSVSATTSGPTVTERFGTIETLAFYGGVLDTTLAAGETRYYRVDTPLDGERLRIIGQWTGSLDVRLEEGMLPLPGISTHRQLHSGLFSERLLTHPWQAGRTYYLRATNASAAPIALTLTIDGRNAATDDEDLDGMPDAWERFYFGNTNQGPHDDFDGDGVTNLNEFLRGTDPTDPDSVIYELRIAGVGASVSTDVEGSLFARDTVVIVTATPDADLAFMGWGANAGAGTADGTTFTAVLNRDIRLTAYAGLPLAEALDAPNLTFTTGGVALAVGQTVDTSDGVDAVRIAGPLRYQEQGWVETTVQGPGRLTFQWRLQGDNTRPSFLSYSVNGTQQTQLFSTNNWTAASLTLGEGPQTIRWTLENFQGQPGESEAAGYLDQVNFLRFEAPVWLPVERINDNTLRLAWEPVPGATTYIIQVFADPELANMLTSQFVSLSHELANPASGVVRYVRMVAFFQGSQGPWSATLAVSRLEAPAPQDSWAQQYGLSAFDPLADLNGDGRTLLYAYALDLDPRTGGGSGIASGVSEIGGVPVLTLTFVRRTDDPRLRYTLREGTSLANTTGYPLAERLVGTPVNIGPGREQVTVRSSLPINPDNPGGFVWLEISLDP